MWLGREWKSDDHNKIMAKYNLPKKYLIFPSQFWIHKNHKRLFEAIALINKNSNIRINLVCTGNTKDSRFPSHIDNLKYIIDRENLQNNIKILGLIPRNEQIQLIRGSAAVITPSLFEGWSAVLNESQSLGKIAFVSDIPMHREQQDCNSIYFNPNDTAHLTKILQDYWPKLIPGPDLRSEKIGIEHYYIKLKNFAHQFKIICNTSI
jgi:glycosyltransferase involved in cell wall biosynthesis